MIRAINPSEDGSLERNGDVLSALLELLRRPLESYFQLLALNLQFAAVICPTHSASPWELRMGLTVL